jgi:putative ABC transport system permease protein
MRWRQELCFIVRRLVHRRRAERELDDEIRAHLEMEVERNVSDGMTPEEARRAAMRSFGSVAIAKEDSRAMWGLGSLETLWQDLRYGARILLKKPGFTLIAVITLALGIGANTAIFSVVNGVLLRPLPYKEPDRLMLIRETKLPQFSGFAVSAANFLDWKAQNTVFERLVAIRPNAFNLTGTGDPERLRGMRVADGFCAILGARPQIGRDFLPEEHRAGRDNVVILSHGFWQRRFGGDPKILNQTISLDGRPHTVVGVMPSAFHFWNRDNDLWAPMAFTPQQIRSRNEHALDRVIGSLKPGVTVDQARAEMDAIAARLAAQYPANAGWGVMLMPLLDYTVRGIKPALLVLLVAVAFVLLIACVNVANLLLARAAERRKEIGVRVALGAGRARIVRQLLTESALLSLLGGAAGLALAKWGVDLLLKLAPEDLPRMGDVSLDGRALAFTAALALLTGVIFGLVPALQSSRPNLNETLKDAGRVSTEGGRRQLGRSALVVLEVASALALLVGAGLMIKSFWRLQNIDPGFDPKNALTVSVRLPRGKYPEDNQRIAFFQQLIEKAGTLPGVQAAGATSLLPLTVDYVTSFRIQGRPPLQPGEGRSVNFYSVSADYFKAMDIQSLRGRLFTEGDTKDSPRVAIINEWMAKKIFPDEDPIGKRITFEREDKDWFEIVGIVGDVTHYDIDQGPSLQVYEPYTQQTFPAMTLVVRAEGDPANLTAAIRSEVLKLDKEQPVSDVRTLDQIYSASIAQRRFSALLIGVFAALALALAAVGVYGVLSYAVAQRRHEIGIRMALGATRRDVLRLVIGRGMRLTLIGVAVGLGAAFALTRLMSTLLFEVSPTDPLTFSSIALLLSVVALLACWIPARRATKVDPLIALRCE